MTDMVDARKKIDIFERDGQQWTTSLNMAEVFRKKHGKVIGKIEDIQCSQVFSRANFGLTEYEDSHGRKQPMYEMTRDGFSFIAMGFTGEKAAKFKEAYIEKFNEMANALTSGSLVLNRSIDAIAKASNLLTGLSIGQTELKTEFVEFKTNIDEKFNGVHERFAHLENKIGDARVKAAVSVINRWYDFIKNRGDALENLCPCCKKNVLFLNGEPTENIVKNGHHVYNRSRANYDEMWFICKECHNEYIHATRDKERGDEMLFDEVIKQYEASLDDLRRYEHGRKEEIKKQQEIKSRPLLDAMVNNS